MSRAAVIAMIAMLASGTVQAETPICAVRSEAVALETRLVQTELMVAALSCGASARYNTFVEKFRPELAAAYQHLSVFFKRAYGNNVEKRVNDYVTRTANESSQRAIAQIDDFCRGAALSFDLMERTDKSGFVEFIHAQPAAQKTGYDYCPEKPARPEPKAKTVVAKAAQSGN